jgi:hypothetical protein
MSPLQLVDPFSDDTPIYERPDSGEEPTRLTIRAEAPPSRRRAAQRCAGLLAAVAAATAGVKLVDSRRSNHYPRCPASQAVISTRSPGVKPQQRRGTARKLVAHHERRRHARHRPQRNGRHQTVPVRRQLVRSSPTFTSPLERPAPPAAGPVTTRRKSPAGPFNYLGR